MKSEFNIEFAFFISIVEQNNKQCLKRNSNLITDSKEYYLN